MISRNTYRIHGLACWLLIALGMAHASGTLVDLFMPTFFAPVDPQVVADMRATPVALGAWLGGEGMTMWRGHLGWNFSMSLGFIFLGSVQLLLRRSNPRLLAATPIVPLATLMALGWTVIAAACWCWLPFVGFVLATLGLAWTWYRLRTGAAPSRGPAADLRLLWISALAIGIAGTLHGLGTLADIFLDGPFSSAAPEVRRAMEQTDLMLPAMFGTSLSTWRAYLGFNLAHALTAICFALTVLLLARDLPGIVARDRALQALFAGVTTLFFLFSLAFWFYPIAVVTGFAMTCNLVFLLRQSWTLTTPVRA